jgi:hypothetical protein
MDLTAPGNSFDLDPVKTAPSSAGDEGAFSRAHIRGDHPVPALDLTGAKRAVSMAIYGFVVAVAVTGTAYTIWARPLLALYGGLIFYFFNNVAFVMAHLQFHAAFIELPESKMSVLIHHSFVHHYRDTGVYHKKWLESRVSYFVDPRAGLEDRAALVFGPVTFATVWFLWRFDPVLGIGFIGLGWAAQLLQSTIHEWYHNPSRNRRDFYNPASYALFTLAEKVGIASTKKHAVHHRHQLDNLNEVVRWLDLEVPLLERLPEYLWRKMVAMHVPGEERMSQFMNKAIFVTFVVVHTSVTLAFLAFHFLLPLT